MWIYIKCFYYSYISKLIQRICVIFRKCLWTVWPQIVLGKLSRTFSKLTPTPEKWFLWKWFQWGGKRNKRNIERRRMKNYDKTHFWPQVFFCVPAIGTIRLKLEGCEFCTLVYKAFSMLSMHSVQCLLLWTLLFIIFLVIKAQCNAGLF